MFGFSSFMINDHLFEVIEAELCQWHNCNVAGRPKDVFRVFFNVYMKNWKCISSFSLSLFFPFFEHESFC